MKFLAKINRKQKLLKTLMLFNINVFKLIVRSSLLYLCTAGLYWTCQFFFFLAQDSEYSDV